MDNLTHTLCGFALARLGLDRAGRWSMPTLLVASNLPDIDGACLLWGDKPGYLEIHRGLTHGVFGLIVQGVLLGLFVTALVRRRGGNIRLSSAIAVAMVGFLTHLPLDALNSYGVRPWVPFGEGWVYFDVAFVADPWIWLLLTFACVLGGPKGGRPARGWWWLTGAGTVLLILAPRSSFTVAAIWATGMAALVGMRSLGVLAGHSRRMAWIGLWMLALYVLVMAVGSRVANRRGMDTLRAQIVGEVQRTSTHPQPGIPWRFRFVAQTEDILHRTTVDLLSGTTSDTSTLARGLDDPVLLNAVATREFSVWQGFARHPFAGIRGQEIILGDGRYSWAVEPGWSNLIVPRQAAGTREEEVGLGVVLRERLFDDLFGAPQSITLLEIDLDRPAVGLRFANARGKTQTSAMGRATRAIAGVNGGYFAESGDAVGLLKINDRLLFENRQARQTAIGVEEDESVLIRAAPIGDWPEVRHALSAGPMLIVDGEVRVAPGFAHELVRHPRTALGLTTNKLVLVAVDGRNSDAAGMTCDELARFMVDLGCHTAVNLDGGGSTTMWVRGSPGNGVVNHPSDNGFFDSEGEREVGNAVLVFAPDVIVRDNDSANLSPGWLTAREGTGFLGDDYAIATGANPWARWSIDVDLPGKWLVMVRWPQRADLSGDARISVGGVVKRLNQSRGGGEWVTIGETVVLDPRTLEIELRGNGPIAADAVRLVQQF